MSTDRAMRRWVTGIIREHTPEGITQQEILDRLLAAGLTDPGIRLQTWIADLIDAGLIAEAEPGRWRMATDQERARLTAAMLSAVDEWDYEFTVVTSPQASPALMLLLGTIPLRTSMTLTEQLFGEFRSGLISAGLLLRDVQRRPHVAMESA